eukprot:CAMPEP_0197832626 /NCGR_PEP_ID=MMETSP1437-20131217/15311_1 /TAXON_ID=49252 ORGANISM="Eucampia antarctica, Strain CCMP1452" /NCGR_SAMPLE_ID=MMETSP1437 /ASSEMBLY_ACC=CAM_ASM_001096 /LENGTH=611 /DNA_ID=CAMNT_0043436079 /DNA_START=59 /DNA_END=1894 /DNA_ORIENTATION=-
MSSPKILHVAGWGTCSFYHRATKVLTSLAVLFPSQLRVIEHEFGTRNEYRAWLVDGGFRKTLSNEKAHNHNSSPFVWFSDSEDREISPSNEVSFLGGHDDTLKWCREFCSPSASASDVAEMVNDGYSKDHDYDYDLVVIGGGSGGLAASKEAASLGAKVAALDFVKPSPAGTAWGLGGTCVNVGCIPKKLMHSAALIRETIHADAGAFGTSVEGQDKEHSWETMRDNIQNHIRGLNFKYRVNLREKNVTYLNKLGKFKDAHTLELTDKKGRKSEVTASRFIVAVGGRPTALDCEGGDLAISSDDVFALPKNPGKTLCVGASYISLECAGFLGGLGLDVTIAVRSILLRGFDRECADLIGEYMASQGIKFKEQVVPKKLEKVDGGDKINVTFSDGSQETFDTVLVAIGRSADTEKLGLDNVKISPNPRNGKIPTKLEQTSCPNIYAIGDVMEGCPELTPVAIGAGISLSRRLFGGSTEPMDYKNICTTVFTPIEYGTVGYSEEDAYETFGKDNVEVYHKSFIPLEWSLSGDRAKHQGLAKVLVDKATDAIIGMHFLGPNAGEVMQGYGSAIKKKLTFKELSDTVGIHPTSAEEFVTLTVTKSSGEDAAAGGC